ncbi:innexin inx4 [Drosophila grimshawi]|uniref:Innexin n=1 Tax=Drosophila grimshawi TaxID=7222 RepID=B4IXW7_DROGR|nr:innexin inx4 [Drosophila grimshawi]EDV96488.1 GH16270 [Drosophila grimshawi]
MYTAVKPLSKYLQLKSVRIYDGIFTLHAKVTCALLLAFTFLLSAKQYFGDPLVCISDMKDMDFVNTHCWTMGMFIMDYDDNNLMANRTKLILDDLNKSFYNLKIDNNLLNNHAALKSIRNGKQQERVFLRYYQWVVPVLLLQSFIFYLPAFLWKIWEGGRLKNLCANLDDVLAGTEKTTAHLRKVAKYFARDYKETHLRYFASYIFCEISNFGISIINILLLNVFLDGFWSHYVKALSAVPAYNWDEWNRITTHMFPKIAKCEIFKFGGSGTLESVDNLCLLPLNNLNEKIFLFLWVWFLLMALLAGLKLMYRLAIVFHRGLRFQLLRAKSRFMPFSSLKRALCEFSCGDWFMLMRVSNNMSYELFHQLMKLIHDELCPTSKPITRDADAC